MRQQKEFQDCPKDPAYWYECEFSVPVPGGLPRDTVIDVLADSVEDAEEVAIATGPSGGILTNVFHRGTAAQYELQSAEWTQGEDYDINDRIELVQTDGTDTALDAEGYQETKRWWNLF